MPQAPDGGEIVGWLISKHRKEMTGGLPFYVLVGEEECSRESRLYMCLLCHF